jgi:Family of unknown function (DUF6152)
MKLDPRKRLIGFTASVMVLPALAHHSYAVFDLGKRVTVAGSVAKFEWTNPHSYLWVYVPRPGNPKEYDLYGFETGSPTNMTRQGWTKSVLKAGDRVSIEYAPLKDGRHGGHLARVTVADGRVLPGDRLVPGGDRAPVASPSTPAQTKP